jgi:Holliday junction DNA helicase RuvA
MICALSGQLARVDDGRVHLQAGAILYELLVPAADVESLRGQVGRELTFHTVFYLEGDAARGNLTPRLIGFLRTEDREFFELFTTVKGIGPKTALRALSAPVGQIAQAIESRDARFLKGLNGIGKRTAELVMAELGGKVQRFVSASRGTRGTGGPPATARAAEEELAIEAMVSLGERRSDAETLLDRARQSAPDLKTTNELVRQMLSLRTTRA